MDLPGNLPDRIFRPILAVFDLNEMACDLGKLRNQLQAAAVTDSLAEADACDPDRILVNTTGPSRPRACPEA